LYFAADRDRMEPLSREAVEIARRLGDTATLAFALSARHYALWGVGDLDERLAIATEIIALAAGAAAMETAIGGHFWRFADLLELGDIVAATRELAAYTALASELRQPFYLWRSAVLHAALALLNGRFDEGERLALDALGIGQRLASPSPALVAGVQIFWLRREQGRLEEMEGAIEAFVAEHPAMPAFRSGMAHLCAELGREAEARAEFEQLAANDFTDLPRDATWLNLLDELSQVCAFLGDARRAAKLYELLLPFAARNIVITFVEACDGAVSHYLGLLAATMSRWEEAAKHFEDALSMNARMAARPFLARTQHEYARLLLGRCRPRDREKAVHLLEEALATADGIGMKRLAERIRLLLAESAGSALAEAALFQLDGDYWTITFRGEKLRLPDSKGLRCIDHLVRHPGSEFHAMDLAAAAERGVAPTAVSAANAARSLVEAGLGVGDLGDAGELLDARAKAEYRRRLHELDEELEEATARNDPGRAANIRAEIEILNSELSGALGLGGRARRAASAAERARIAVTKRIQAAIERITAANPTLGQHLKQAIRTGTFFSYLGV
ncbi:MAG: hypothetical protein ACREQQ_09425, partial [Candidatus Binatia bacterium]